MQNVRVIFSKQTDNFPGCVAVGLTLLGGISGLFIYEVHDQSSMHKGTFGIGTYIHLTLGILGSIACSMCFLSGISKEIFGAWVPLRDMYRFMLLGCIFYTCIILYKPAIMLLTRRRDGFLD